MKLIPSESGLANSVEKREFSVENTCNKLPRFVSKTNRSEYCKDDDSNRETCLWKKPKTLVDSDIDNYVNNLKQMGYHEDQALLVLQCNGYNFTSAVADICQYRPKIGLFEMDVVATAEKISRIMINIRKSSLKRKRCFKQIHSKFPNYTMGDLLHFYMSNKLKIKRRLAKYKKQYTKLSKIPSEQEFDEIIARVKDLTPIDVKNGESKHLSVEKIPEETDAVWNRQEVFGFFQALGMFGENFLMISQYVGNKTENMVKLFYAQHVKNAI